MKQEKFSLTERYCEICGKPLSFVTPGGKKVHKSVYVKRRFCSYECTNKWKSEHQKIENPRHDDRLYHVWLGMKERCNNPNGRTAKWYYEKGIRVCDEWLNDFIAFREWAVSNGYDYSKTRKEQSLDRIDDSKGYSPDNCRWVTHSENCKNTTRNIFISYKGKTQCLNDWSKELNIPIETLRNRVKRFDEPEKIFDKEKFNHRSNTGIKGISLVRGHYHVHINHKYLGSRKTLEEAKELKKQYVEE